MADTVLGDVLTYILKLQDYTCFPEEEMEAQEELYFWSQQRWDLFRSWHVPHIHPSAVVSTLSIC